MNNVDVSADFNVIDQTLVITLTKELDHHSTAYIREMSDSIMDRQNIKNIVINFEYINFMDSSGIGVIMGRYKRIIYNGGKMIAVNMMPSIRRIFRVSGLHKIMSDCSNMKEAMEILS